jgi:hypothetical protein
LLPLDLCNLVYIQVPAPAVKSRLTTTGLIGQ